MSHQGHSTSSILYSSHLFLKRSIGNVEEEIYVDWLRIVAIAQRVHSTYRLFQPI
jgi:hypothetical protein